MKRKTIAGLIAIVIIAVVVMFSGCVDEKTLPQVPDSDGAGWTDRGMGPSESQQEMYSSYPEAGIEKAAIGEDKGFTSAEAGTQESQFTGTERKIIKKASLSIEVEDVQSRFDAVIDIIERSNGFVSDSYTYVTGAGHKEGDITLRVPQENFLVVITEIERIGSVKSKRISGEDVTEEYIDLKSRINNSVRQEQRLLEILGMANNTEEVLEVEREIWRVRGEIEWLTGRILYLGNRVELATISISLYEPEPITHSWGIRDTLRSAFEGFVMVILGLIILVGYTLPILILVGIGWLFKSKLKARKERKGK
jgi:hypothetical protein